MKPSRVKKEGSVGGGGGGGGGGEVGGGGGVLRGENKVSTYQTRLLKVLDVTLNKEQDSLNHRTENYYTKDAEG